MTKKEVFVIAVDKTQQLLIAAPPTNLQTLDPPNHDLSMIFCVNF